MPKIIKDLDDKIFAAAKALFDEYGYQHADMKKIAKKVGIAVGTLYNYYPNKQQLFLAVFHKSWESTLTKLDVVLEADIESNKKLVELMRVLNDEMRKRKGLGKELMVANAFGGDEEELWGLVHTALRKRIECVLSIIELENGVRLEETKQKRLIEMILVTNFSLHIQMAEDEEENMAFLEWIVKRAFGIDI